MSKSGISRREFLRLTALGSAAVLISACAPTGGPVTSGDPPKSSEPTKIAIPASKYIEAPLLVEQVKAGKLPPVDQRLPDKPLVVKGLAIGKYGGNWRMGSRGGGDDALFTRIFAHEQLVRWNPDWTGIIPNIAEKYEINKDATEFTFYLRKGLRWSDGTPFTANDIVFLYDEILSDPELKIAMPVYMKIAGEAGKITKIDDYTVKFIFPKPYGLFLNLLATPDTQPLTNTPAAFARKYMAKYVDRAKLDADIKAAGFTTYLDYFQFMVYRGSGSGINPVFATSNRPTLFPYVVDQPLVGSSTQVTFKRNPYFFKVDPNGQQYPYIDTLTADIYADIPTMLLKASNGEIDFQMRHFNTGENKATLFENQKKGDYTFFTLKEASNNKEVIYFNMSHKDPAKRAILGNKDFRIGMSHAINRQEIIDTVFVGQGKPFQAAPLEATPFYNHQLATQYIEYDTKKANDALDKVLPKKGSDGMRLMPDGKPLSLVIETASANNSDIDTAKLLIQYWKAVGVAIEHKIEDRAVLYQRKDANDLDAMIWGGEGGMNPIMDPRSYLPVSTEAAWGAAWALWYSGANSEFKEEPPREVRKTCDLYDQLKGAPTYGAQVEMMKQILQVAADNFWCIGVCTPPDLYGIRKNNFKNVPDNMINSWVFPTAAPYNPFTFYFDTK